MNYEQRDAVGFEQAAQRKDASLAREMWQFLAANKKWWLLPIFIMMFALGVLAVLGSSAAAPFIYTLF